MGCSCSGMIAAAALAACAGLAALAPFDGARAASARTTWSTYLRSGPGDAYPVIDEIEHDTVVDIGGCSGRWCHVLDGRTSGYIDKDALALPKPASGAAQRGGPQGCFVSAQTGYRRPAQTQFCGTKPAVSPPGD